MSQRKVFLSHSVVVVHSLSHVQPFTTQWTAACQASLSSTISQSFFKFMSISKWCYITISSSASPFFCLQSFTLSGFFFFPHELALFIGWPKNWSFSFSISSSSEYSGLIFHRNNWFDLLAVQGTQESSPVPQFKTINFGVFNHLYGSALISANDYHKNHSF